MILTMVSQYMNVAMAILREQPFFYGAKLLDGPTHVTMTWRDDTHIVEVRQWASDALSCGLLEGATVKRG